MSQRILAALSLLILGGASSLAATPPAGPVGADGLVTLQASKLDEFSVRPNADLASYRKVIIDPAKVEFKKGWLKAINSTRDLSRWLTASDQQQIADTAAASLNGVVADAFKARGYEIVTAPGPGVLRVSPRVTELYVNAPDVPAAAPARLFNVDAGDATLALEARDSASGTLAGAGRRSRDGARVVVPDQSGLRRHEPVLVRRDVPPVDGGVDRRVRRGGRCPLKRGHCARRGRPVATSTG